MAVLVEPAGVALLRGKKDAFSDFQAMLSNTPLSNSARAFALGEMAWWMYRARKLNMAAQQLEEARQLLPQTRETNLQLFWVLTDLGRQADAQQLELAASRSFPLDEGGAEWRAAAAVRDLRTDGNQDAVRQFQMVAAADPVWMNPHWVENNYSASAAGVIRQLEILESARRSRETRARER